MIVMDSDPITLLEFTSKIGSAIHTRPELRNVWITAELSDMAVRGGHFFADLIQKDNSGNTVARLRANIWASSYARIYNKYLQHRNEEIRNGIKVKIQGSATHHNIYGLAFNISDIDPDYVDEGDILRRRMEILDRMKKENIFDDNRSAVLPADNQRIAVISAPGAAGLGDFMNQLGSSQEDFRFTVRLFESKMQGDGAARGVIEALDRIAAEADLWDCVVIIRGGGATADMNCFDNEPLARTVCLFPLPIIVGIGHERDNCVLDYIAHTRCKTPTAVAEFLISHQRQAWAAVCERVNEITRYAGLYLDGEKQRLAQFEAFIPSFLNQLLERENLRLKNLTTAIPLASNSITTREQTRLQGYHAQLQPAISAAIARAKDRLRSTFELIEVIKPENTLKRGFSITRVGGKALRDASSLEQGAIIETQLASGTLSSKVE